MSSSRLLKSTEQYLRNIFLKTSRVSLYDTLAYVTSHHFISPRFTSGTLHASAPITSLHFNQYDIISLYFTSFQLTSLHFTSFHSTSLHFTSINMTSFHFTSPTSPQFTSLHFTLSHFNSLQTNGRFSFLKLQHQRTQWTPKTKQLLHLHLNFVEEPRKFFI